MTFEPKPLFDLGRMRIGLGLDTRDGWGDGIELGINEGAEIPPLG